MELHSLARERTPLLVMLDAPKIIAKCEETFALVAFHHHIFSERSVARPNYAHFTFEGRTRQCIGKGFALMKVTLVLALPACGCGRIRTEREFLTGKFDPCKLIEHL
jgi:hypothetical protein